MRSVNELFGFFKKKHGETSKGPAEHSSRSKSGGMVVSHDTLLKVMPSWWVVALAYLLAAAFCYGAHQFFLWFPPYLQEVFRNLKGLPVTWADLGIYWAERGLTWIAVAAALYHQLWQISTRYKLTSHDIQVESWFPKHLVTAAPYGSVRRVGYQQSLLGFLLNYGHVEIDTGGAFPLLLLNCPQPKKLVGLLQPKVESILQPHGTSHR